MARKLPALKTDQTPLRRQFFGSGKTFHACYASELTRGNQTVQVRIDESLIGNARLVKAEFEIAYKALDLLCLKKAARELEIICKEAGLKEK